MAEFGLQIHISHWEIEVDLCEHRDPEFLWTKNSQ